MDAQQRFAAPHKKMLDRVQIAPRVQRLKAIRVFYDVAEPTKYEQLPLEVREEIEAYSDEELLSFCTELCTEAINRDFVSYVSTGQEGTVGKTVYNALF